jgi:HEAT repeat protein
MPETALRAAFLEADSAERIRAMMEDKDEAIIMYAMDLAAAIDREDIIPASLASHSSRDVRLKALDLVSLSENEYRQRLTEETESGVLAKVLSRGCSVVGTSGSEETLEEHLSSPDVRVRLAAISCLASSAPKRDMQMVKEYLTRAVGQIKDSSTEWSYVAKALGEIHHPAAVDLHMHLMNHPDRTVRKNAILSAGKSGHRELVPILVRLLASPESSSSARAALREFHERILGTLSDIFTDPYEDIEIRRQIPLVLAYIPNQQAVDILVGSLSNEDRLLRFRAIRALNQLRIGDNRLHFDADAIGDRIKAESERALWYDHAWKVLYSQRESADLLEQLLREKARQGREMVFRLLGLMLPPAAAHAAYNAIVEKDRLQHANAVEYLDSALSSEVRNWVLPLVEKKNGTFKEGTSEIVEVFAKSKDWVLRECARDAATRNAWIPSHPVEAE